MSSENGDEKLCEATGRAVNRALLGICNELGDLDWAHQGAALTQIIEALALSISAQLRLQECPPEIISQCLDIAADAFERGWALGPDAAKRFAEATAEQEKTAEKMLFLSPQPDRHGGH